MKEARKAHPPRRPGTADTVEKPKPKLTQKTFDKELKRLQRELVLMQEYIRERGLKVVVIFEGRDAAGKGGVIKRIMETAEPARLSRGRAEHAHRA